MMKKTGIKPSPAMSRMGIVVGAAFFVFGLIFLFILVKEGSDIGVLFVIFWLFVVGVIIFFNARNLIRRSSLVDIETETEERAEGEGADFDSKLRKLAALRKEGLINEEEFRAKREEMLREKW